MPLLRPEVRAPPWTFGDALAQWGRVDHGAYVGMNEPSRIEWAEWRLDQIDEFRETHYIPAPLEAMRKQARRLILLEIVKGRKGQSRIEDF